MTFQSAHIRRLVALFWETLKISLFVVGGGYAIIAVADEVFARKRKWTTEGELLDNLALYQMLPGIMSAHNAVYVGRKVAGWQGALIGLVAVAIPSLVIFTLVSMGYQTIPLENPWLQSCFVGLRAAMTGLILAVVVRSWRKNVVGSFGWMVTAVSFVLLSLPGVPVAGVIGGAILLGLAAAVRPSRRLYSFSCAPLLFLKYGFLAFGGGYVLVPMYLQDFVGPTATFLRLPAEEFANLMALTQMTPGPIGINAATFFGYRLGGIVGAALATLALLLPGFVLALCAYASLERFRTNRFVVSVMRWIAPVTTALLLQALLSFLNMSVWDVAGTARSSWCTFTSLHLNLVSLCLVSASFVLIFTKRLSTMRVVFLSALVATLVRA